MAHNPSCSPRFQNDCTQTLDRLLDLGLVKKTE